MDSIFEYVINSKADRLRSLLDQEGIDPNLLQKDGLSPLHLAAIGGNQEILELLLKHYNTRIDIQDGEGNTALHLAVSNNQIESIKTLLAFGVNATIMNSLGKKPIDYSQNTEISSLLLKEREGAMISKDSKAIEQARTEMILQIASELPNDLPNLKSFSLELMLANQLFQERCKEVVRQLIEEKHIALHKYRLLDNAAGILDAQTSSSFLSQLQYLQLENEQNIATIGYLKIQNRNLVDEASGHEAYIKKNLMGILEQHQTRLKAMSDTFQTVEEKVLASSFQPQEKLTTAGNETAEYLNNKIIQVHVEKALLLEKIRICEQARNFREQEVVKLRNDINTFKKIMQDSMIKVLTDVRAEADDRDENSGQIVFMRNEDGSRQIKGATPEKLVERVTDQATFENHFQSTILLTYRCFTDAHTLLGMLVKRYRDNQIDPRTAGAGTTFTHFQNRVCNFLKSWVLTHWYDFENDKDLLRKLNEFVDSIQRSNEKLAKLISEAIESKRNENDDYQTKVESKETRPKPILPKSLVKRAQPSSSDSESKLISKVEKVKSAFNFGRLKLESSESSCLKLKLSDIDPTELARQLCLIEFGLFSAIKPIEFLDQAWLSKDIKASNIIAMLKWSNHVTKWVATEIVSVKDSLKNRVTIFEKFIMIAQALEKLNNFNGAKEIITGLQSPPVYRLKKTRSAISEKHLKIFEDLVKLVRSDLNFKDLRTKVIASDPPKIPVLAVYQNDLVFLDTCSKNKLDNGLINVIKFQKTASYIMEVQAAQRTSYNLELVPEIVYYVRDFPVVSDEQSHSDSAICEPRGT